MAQGLFSLDGRVALVTGALRGIGAAIAKALAEAGADVAVHGNQTPAVATCEGVCRFGRKAAALVADMADPAAPDRLVRETVAALGGLDIVVNNAGIIRRGPTVDTTDEDWNAVIDVNLHGVFRLCRAAAARSSTSLRSSLSRADETRNRQILERIPAGRWGETKDLEGAAVFLASRASDYVNGQILAVDGGWLGR